ncbi:MAG: hypothetical protein ACUVWA_15220 [Candidatus Oleimicrobiaceae bacterium]
MTTQLDLKCAQTGEQLAKIENVDEKLLNSTLAVLQEQGLYACFLYLKARRERHTNEMVRKMYDFLHSIPTLNLPQNQDNELSAVATLTENLDNLLFARELLLQVLTYARYHLKAKSGGGV